MKLVRYARTLPRNEWIRGAADLAHASTVLEPPVELWAAEPQGDRLVLLALPADDVAPLHAAVRRVQVGNAPRANGMFTAAKIFGYQPRFSLRHDYCTGAALNHEQPADYAVLAEYAQRAERAYAEHNPALYAQHKATLLRDVKPCWRMGASVFTSGIVNRNNPLRYHTDTGNFPALWSAMYVLPDGTAGGELVLPEYRLALRWPGAALVMFAGQELMHGVTTIERTRVGGVRHSVVYYALRGMCRCLEPAAELARIRTVRTERERKRARGEAVPDPRRGDKRWSSHNGHR